MSNVVTDSLCNELLFKVDAALETLRQAKRALTAAINTLKSLLSEFIPDILPDLPDLDFGDINDLTNLLSNCGAMDAAAWLNSVANLDAFLDSYIPTSDAFGLFNKLDALNKNYEGYDLHNIIPFLDTALNCLSYLCGHNVAAKIDEMNDIMTSMYLNGQGVLDKAGMCSGAGLSEESTTSLTDAGDQMTSWKDNIKNNMPSL